MIVRCVTFFLGLNAWKLTCFLQTSPNCDHGRTMVKRISETDYGAKMIFQKNLIRVGVLEVSDPQQARSLKIYDFDNCSNNYSNHCFRADHAHFLRHDSDTHHERRTQYLRS